MSASLALALLVAGGVSGDWPDEPDLFDGVWSRRIDPSGTPASEGMIFDDLYEGTWARWHATGYLSDLGVYRHDHEDGLWRSWDERGRLAVEGEWINGRPEGTWRFFHPNGAIAIEGSYVDGVRQGPWSESFDDGTVFRVLEWRDGSGEQSETESACVEGDEEWRVDLGHRTEGCVDSEGRPTGRWRGFYPSGAVAWERTWSIGLLDEEAFDYHPDGSLLHRGAYRVGAPDGVHTWSAPDGGVYGTSELVNGTGPWRAYWPDGTLREDGEWVGFRRVGPWRGWDEHGALVSEVRWKDNQRNGPARFVVDGMWLEGLYVGNTRNGPWVARDGDGKRVWQGSYDDGRRTELWRIARRDPNGAAGEDALEVFFADDEEAARVAFWPNGNVRETRDSDGRQCFDPDGVLIRADDDAPEGTAFVDPEDDQSTAWLRALELQAWLLEDEPLPEALWDSTVPSPDETGTAASKAGANVVEPVAQDIVSGRGQTNDEGAPTGAWTYFHDNGARREQGSFVDGVRQGEWRAWDRDEHPTWVGRFVDDKPDGHWRSFHRDGSLALEGDFAAGVRVGSWVWYHPSAGPSVIGAYKGGVPDGTWRGFHRGGLPQWQGDYAVGRRVGTWTFWRRDASVERVVRYGEDGRELRR